VRPPRNGISRLLALRGWSDADLAQRCSLSRAHVNRVKNRRVRPTVRDALLICGALGVRVEDVFWLDDLPQ
jgi:putative transcriptional regulator